MIIGFAIMHNDFLNCVTRGAFSGNKEESLLTITQMCLHIYVWIRPGGSFSNNALCIGYERPSIC